MMNGPGSPSCVKPVGAVSTPRASLDSAFLVDTRRQRCTPTSPMLAASASRQATVPSRATPGRGEQACRTLHEERASDGQGVENKRRTGGEVGVGVKGEGKGGRATGALYRFLWRSQPLRSQRDALNRSGSRASASTNQERCFISARLKQTLFGSPTQIWSQPNIRFVSLPILEILKACVR